MMRKVFSVALMAFAFGLVQSANAGITIDLTFQDATTPTGITINAGDAGTGCNFGGFGDGSVASGYCMDVTMTTDMTFVAMVVDVSFDKDDGLALASAYNWVGPILGWSVRGAPNFWCASAITPTENVPGNIKSFDCQTGAVPPPSVQPGTYRIGTIVWDTSGTTSGTEVIAAVINAGYGGVTAVINGELVAITAADTDIFSLGTHILTIIPEPGTASLLGLGLVGLVLAGRRSRA